MAAQKPISPTSTSKPKGPRANSRSNSTSSGLQSPDMNNLTSAPSLSPQKARTNSVPPTSPVVDNRDRPGSSRTKYYVPRSNASSSPTATLGSPLKPAKETFSAPLIDLEDTSMPAPAIGDEAIGEVVGNAEIDMDAPHAPYRSPEPVIEPEEAPPGYVIAEHSIHEDDHASPHVSPLRAAEKSSFDIVDWQQHPQEYEAMDLDDSLVAPDRPSIGPGVLPIRLMQMIHEHDLWQPKINVLPKPNPPKGHAFSSSTSETPNIPEAALSTGFGSTASLASMQAPSTDYSYDHVATEMDVLNAIPGGEHDWANWYFCPDCWGWLRITAGHGDPDIPTMEQWGMMVDQPDETRRARFAEWARYNDLKQYRMYNSHAAHHMHAFEHLAVSTHGQNRIERIPVDDEVNAFPHVALSFEQPDSWSSHEVPFNPATLYVSSGSDLWVLVETMIPGQLPKGLVNDFTKEKSGNPGVGQTGAQSIAGAWSLISTLLANPLFKKQRGWVQLENNKFKREIGATLASSNLLYQIGFGCRPEKDVLRVGPFLPNEKISKADVETMDRYMLRTWLEISLYRHLLNHENGAKRDENEPILAGRLNIDGPDCLNLRSYPRTPPTGREHLSEPLHVLGVSTSDVPATIMEAYDLQVACDPSRTKLYLTALETIAERAQVAGQESLQLKVATERSIDRYTVGDLKAGYELIGYTDSMTSSIGVPPEEAPAEYILDLHRKKVQAAASSYGRAELSKALLIIGKERDDAMMVRLARENKTFVSVQDAYAAFGAPGDCTDEGLVMQYDLAVTDFPGKADYYKMCLEVIANAPGAERPGIKSYLETGSTLPDVPVRTDIPVGLHNIGNTCYLNSILQYLYSIKPLREAVMTFEQTPLESKTPLKPEIERSRRFVRQLRLLFLQLYRCEGSSVRPEEELAYLAITRPEIDQIVEPETAKPRMTLDSIPDIPDIPSNSSTRVNTPDVSPTIPHTSLPGSPRRPEIVRASSVLGKRPSEDRDDSSRSSEDHSRQKSDGFEELGNVTPINTGMEDDYEMVSGHRRDDRVESPSAATDLGALKLKSPELETPDEQEPTEIPEPNKVTESVKEMAVTVPPPLPPRPTVARKDTLASGLRFGLQQDSAEVLINVLTQLEMAFDPSTAKGESEKPNLISELFSCKYRQQTFYESSSGSVEAQTPVESVFVHPIIGVEEEGKDLYDCLAELYLRGDEIEYEGKKGYMMDLMDSFPPMLYIQMRRSQYDFKTGRETKTNTHIAFDQTLCVDRFLASADKAKREESVEITREMSKIRSRLHQLKNNKPMSIPGTFLHAREALSILAEDEALGITPDFLSALDNEGEEVKKEIEQLEGALPDLKKRLDKIWEDSKEYEYELVSVFMHRGKTSGAGHYWTYQAHLPDHSEQFFKYNDELVTPVPASEVLQDRTGSDANPALLCYVRKGQDLVDTLHREVLAVNNLLGDEEADQPEQIEQVE